MIKKLIAGVLALSLAVGAQAQTSTAENFAPFEGATLYVDAANPNAGDGTAASPYQSIQAAVDAASAGDTIKIAAGEYKTGTTVVTLGEVDTLTRVVVDKRLHLEGAGRGKTVVLGADATVNPDEDGLGDDAVRCLYLTADAANSLIEGITFKGGRTVKVDTTQTTSTGNIWAPLDGTDTPPNKLAMTGANLASIGGGVLYAVQASAYSETTYQTVWFVDCQIEDGRAGFSGGAAYGRITLIRTLVNNSWAQACHGGVLNNVHAAYNSIFAGNCNAANSVNTVHGENNGSANDFVGINCTMTGNFGRGTPQYNSITSGKGAGSGNIANRWTFRNCIFYVNGSYRYTTGGTPCKNCCQNEAGSLVNDGSGSTPEEKLASSTNIGGDYNGTRTLAAGSYGGFSNPGLPPYYKEQFVSGYGDWHLREGSALIDQGNSTYVTTDAAKFVPEAYLGTDYYGAERVQGDQVDMGAAEGGVASDGTVYTLSAGSYPLFVNGIHYNSSCPGLRVTGKADDIIELGADLSKQPVKSLYGWSTETAGCVVNDLKTYSGVPSYAYLFPDWDETTVQLRVTPASFLASATYTCRPAVNVIWVSPDGDDNAAGDFDHPWKTLQKSVTSGTTKYRVVFAKPGVYAENEGGCTTDGDWLQSTKCRVTIPDPLRLVGVEGAEKTVIMGRSHQVTPDEIAAGEFVNGRCGRGALRCVGMTGGIFAQVQGFTLTGGAVDADPKTRNLKYRIEVKGKTDDTGRTGNDTGAFNWGGAGVCGGSYNTGHISLHVADCIISNNVAYRASAAIQALLKRCVITENHIVDMSAETNAISNVGWALNACPMVNCVAYNNDVLGIFSNMDGASKGGYVNCIFCDPDQKASTDSIYSYNSIYYNCHSGFALKGSGNVIWPTIIGWADTDCYTKEDVGLRSDVGPFLGAKGTAVETGGQYVSSYQSDYMRFVRMYHCKSMDGVWPTRPAEGNAVVAGCYQKLLPFIAKVTAAGENPGELSDGTKALDYGETVVLDATTATRPIASFTVDGVEEPTLKATITAPAAPGYSSPFAPAEPWTPPTVVATFGTDWYVDAKNGDDANNGWTPETAKKTLAAVMANVVSGDTVHALPGAYDQGVMTNETIIIAAPPTTGGAPRPAAVPSPSRVVVPAGVTLVSTGGKDVTTIKGAWHSASARMGDNAIRCVALYANARLEGFTLTDGGTKSLGGGVFDDNAGALVMAPSAGGATARIVNCALTRGGASRGGCNYGGIFERCVITDCTHGSDGITYASKFSNCLFASLTGSLFRSCYGLDSCTVDATYPNASTDPEFGMTSNGYIQNSILYYSSFGLAYGSKVVTASRIRNSLVIASEGKLVYDATCSNNITNNTYAEIFADDHRLFPESVALDAGSNDLLETYDDGKGDRVGNRRISHGIVDLGCYEYLFNPKAHVTATGGTIEPSEDFEVNPGETATVRAADDERNVISFTVTTNGAPVELPVGTREYTWAPTEETDTLTVDVTYSTDWYVDADNGNDENDGWTAGTAKKTLAAAMANVLSGDTVHAAAGIYNEGTMMNPVNLIGGTAIPSRVVIPAGVALVATEGPDVTFIEGRPHSASTMQGADSVRGVYLYNGSRVEGFTIRKCYTVTTSYEAENSCGGCIVAPKMNDAANRANPGRIVNCVLTEALARSGSGGMGGFYERCKFLDLGVNSGGVTMYGTFVNCYFNTAKGSAGNMSIFHSSYGIYSCSVLLSRSIAGDADFLNVNAPIENSLIYYYAGGKATTLRNAHNCVVYATPTCGFTIDDATCSNIITNNSVSAVFDVEGRPVKGSPLIDAGDNTLLDAYDDGKGDLDGNPRISHGIVDIGCYEYQYKPTAHVSATGGNIEPSEDFEVSIGESETVRATDDERNLLSFTVITNGTPVVLPAGTREYTWSPTTEDDTLSVDATYSTNWYVNANADNDDGNGWTPETAKKTLVGIMTAPGLRAGDTVHAAAGDYNEGMITNTTTTYFGFRTDGTRHPSRVLIPTGVSLVADEGPEKTTIWGQWNGASKAQGPNAIRAVYMMPNTRLEGFTVTHGACSGHKSGGTQDDNCGGNVLGAAGNVNPPSRVVNCILTEGIARSGGAAAGCVLERCVMHDNSVDSDGITYGSRLYHCVMYNNGASRLRNHYGVYSCSIHADDATGDPDLLPAGTSPIENTILYYAKVTKPATLKYARNCVIYNPANLTIDDATCSNLITNNSATAIMVSKTDLHLVAGSPAIDAADEERFAAYYDGKGDCEYGQRVYNGAVDIGAYEYDWRGDYAKYLKNGKVEVTEASPDVVLADNTLTLNPATAFTLKILASSLTDYTVNFKVSGGTLTIGEKTFTSDGSYVIEKPQQDQTLTFSYSGTDTATIAPIVSAGGLMLYIR